MKKMMAMVLVLLALTAATAMADSYYYDLTSLPENSQQTAEAAAKTHLPQATIHYTNLDRDDRRFEWDVFFSKDGALGVCEVDAETGKIIRTKEYTDVPAGALTADAAIEALRKAKGNITILDLDLDRDDGRLEYEGEAELDGRFYDFEMTVEGRIIEWERD